MKKIFIYFVLGILFSCNSSESADKNEDDLNIITKDYTIIKEVKNKAIKKTSLEIVLEEEISKDELKKIAQKIKSERKDFINLWIFYYLPEHEIGLGAWATTHFNPNLEVVILGATKEASEEMNKRKVTGTILNVWKDNDAIMPSKIYLVEENGILLIKTVYAKSKYNEGSEIINQVTKKTKNGLVRYNYKNNHGEYYVVEKNGNLGLYDNEGKFKEAIKEK